MEGASDTDEIVDGQDEVLILEECIFQLYL